MSDRAPRRPAHPPRTETIALIGPVRRGPTRGTASWNAPRAWRWIAGHWAARLELPILGPSPSHRLRPRLTTQSVDAWRVDASGVRILALAGPLPGLPAAANLAVEFDPAGLLPTLKLASPIGPATTLLAVEATARAITFQGRPSADDAGQVLRVTIEQVGRAGLRIVAELGEVPGGPPLFSYSARKLADDQAA